MSDAISLALVVVAVVLAAIDLIDGRGRDLLGWAVIALAIVLLIGRLT